MSGAGPALVAGELRGYRRFRVGPDGALHPPVRGGDPWSPGLHRAACTTGHDAPAAGCGCGLHAWSTPHDAVGAGDVLASVLVRGRTVVAEHGVRAAAGRVEAVVVRDAATRRAVAARYPGVAVLRSRRALQRAHPPQRVAGLGSTSPAARSRRAFTAAWAGGLLAFYAGVTVTVATGSGAPVVLGGVLGGQAVLAGLAARSLRGPAGVSPPRAGGPHGPGPRPGTSPRPPPRAGPTAGGAAPGPTSRTPPAP